MNERRRHKSDRSFFGQHPKVEQAALVQVVYYFCHGISVDAVAKTVGLSRKSVRDLYIELRARLPKAKFARWHNANRALINIASTDEDVLIRATFFDVLAECGLNNTCHRNFEAGNRRSRLCRSCPLPSKLSSVERVTEALTQIDAVRSFYRRIRIHGETEKDAVSLFRLRLIHTVVVLTAIENGRQLKSGLLDPAHRAYLSFGTLVQTLMEDLVEPPEVKDAAPAG